MVSKEKKVYAIGQKLVFTEDAKIEKAFGEKEIIKKGTRIFVGADRFAHHLNGYLQPISEDSEVKGFSVNGIAEWLYEYLNRDYYLEEMLGGNGTTKEEFMESIADALEELGMYDATGNRM